MLVKIPRAYSTWLVGVNDVKQSRLTGGPRAFAPTFLIASAIPSTASIQRSGENDAVEEVALAIRKVRTRARQYVKNPLDEFDGRILWRIVEKDCQLSDKFS